MFRISNVNFFVKERRNKKRIKRTKENKDKYIYYCYKKI